jgi:hypothetical protein
MSQCDCGPCQNRRREREGLVSHTVIVTVPETWTAADTFAAVAAALDAARVRGAVTPQLVVVHPENPYDEEVR